jgi:hypothetical protein
MSIIYTYKIISVDQAARCMEVVYTAESHPTMHIGTRLPFEDEALETVIAQFAPVAYWQELQRPVAVPQVGTTGVVASPAPAIQEASDTAFAPIFPTPASGGINHTVFE